MKWRGSYGSREDGLVKGLVALKKCQLFILPPYAYCADISAN